MFLAQVHGARSGAGHFWSFFATKKSGYVGLSWAFGAAPFAFPDIYIYIIYIIYIYNICIYIYIYIYLYLSGFFFWVTVDQTGVQVGWISGNVSRSAKGPEGKTVLTTFEPNRDGGLSGSGFHMGPSISLDGNFGSCMECQVSLIPQHLHYISYHFVIDYFHSRGILENKPSILGWFLQPCMVLMIHENMALPQAPSHR